MEVDEGRFGVYFYNPADDYNIDLTSKDVKFHPVETGYRVKIRARSALFQGQVGERVRVCVKDAKKRFFATLACSDYLNVIEWNNKDSDNSSSGSSENPFA